MKTRLNQNVYDAAIERIRFILSEFDHYYVSFSGGKDSGVLLQLVIQEAKLMGRLPVPVMFLDWEAIYQETHKFIERQLSRPEVDAHWICLPVTERNGSSVFEPFWRPFDPAKQHLWVRPIPEHPAVIHEGNMPEDWKPWYDPSNHDQFFFIKYGDWFAKKHNAKKVANFVAIRVDESHDRYKMLKTQKNRIKYESKDWCYRYKENEEEVWYTMPIYDWHVTDIWTCIGKENLDYNRIYDRMYKMGVPLHDQRICNPYGEQQKRGLHQFHECEPESWFRIVNRVAGANYGSAYNKSKLTRGQTEKPGHLTWKQYLRVLLDSLPEASREHYRHIIARTLFWHRKRRRELGGKIRTIHDTPDTFPKGIKINDLVSYRLMCNVIIKGDYWGRKLYFAETKKERERQAAIIEKYKDI